MLKKLPTLIGFLCHFKVKFNVEKYAAIQSYKLHNFEKEWDVLKNILEWFFYFYILNIGPKASYNRILFFLCLNVPI